MVQGADALRRRFERVAANVEKEMQATLTRYAESVVADMKKLVPVDEGTVRDSIGFTFGEIPKGTISVGTVETPASGDVKVRIYAGGGEAFYARFLEFGTRKMPAHPFFFPAWRANRRRIRSGITRAIRKAIRDA